MRGTTRVGAGMAIAAGGALLGWPAWAAVTWARYGHPRRPFRRDRLADRFLPAYEAVERHEARVAAPAALTFAATRAIGLQRSGLVRAIIHGRERLLRVRGESVWPPGGLAAQMRSWGWAVLAEEKGREVVLGTVTQPWRGDVRFRTLTPDAFVAFDEPGYVKILSVIAVEPVGAAASIVRTETRVATTDAVARARFRRYWAVFSPGIVLIRRALLRLVRREAERHWHDARLRRPTPDGAPGMVPVPAARRAAP
jgi:hypothetical protein